MSEARTYWNLVEPVWDTVSIYDGAERFLREYADISQKQQVLFSTHWCQSEIRNGGLQQFFENSTGVLAPEAEQGFRSLGMPNCANAVARGMAFFGAEYPRSREYRQERLADYEGENPDEWDPFLELDDAFYNAIDEEGGGFQAAAERYAYDT